MIQNHNYLLRCKMFFFQIECKKNTKSFVLQMLAAHNVAIILNIWDAWIITKILRNTEVKAFLYSFTKKKKKKVCHSCFRNGVPSFYQWLITKTEGRDVMTSSCLFSFFQHSKFRIIQIVLPLALSGFCAAKKILYSMSVKRIILIAFYRYFTISVHVANLVWIWSIILLPV